MPNKKMPLHNILKRTSYVKKPTLNSKNSVNYERKLDTSLILVVFLNIHMKVIPYIVRHHII
jgi:hypothetical protein